MGAESESMDLSHITGRKPCILIADDDWFNRDLLQTMLQNNGAEVLAAVDGQDALEKMAQQIPDLAILDIHMPRMDGLSVCSAIKSDTVTHLTPVIIVTAYDTDEQKINAIDAGADDFLSKPYSSIVLLTRVRSLLRMKKLHDEIEARNHLLRQVLGRFVDDEVADIILTDPDRYLQLGGETRSVTILFADIRGFSSYTEKHSAEHVIETLNEIFKPLSQVIFNHQGTFDKYLGDGLMAFFGAPIPHRDAPQRAMDAAVTMQRIFQNLCSSDKDRFCGLGLGIGLHSGEAVVGNIGSEQFMDYTVIGDVVNIAKRLQERARGGQILLTSATYDLVKPMSVSARALKPLRLTGRNTKVSCYLVEQGEL
ncbi:MAG: response regulator [Anaerolineales bacterium]|nr:response regulator [Anaerolineales bacterium]